MLSTEGGGAASSNPKCPDLYFIHSVSPVVSLITSLNPLVMKDIHSKFGCSV
jgi:hypothetical protein